MVSKKGTIQEDVSQLLALGYSYRYFPEVWTTFSQRKRKKTTAWGEDEEGILSVLSILKLQAF